MSINSTSSKSYGNIENVLIIGNGGRENSLAWAIQKNELASRIDDSKAKILITASCGFEPGRTVEYRPLVEGALKLAKHQVEKVILFQRKGHEVKLNTTCCINSIEKWHQIANQNE